MTTSVADRGRTVATFRFVEVRLMEMAAAWTPTTPELEAKVVLGRHIWDFAQHADALGRRTFELRLPLQHSIAAAPEYLALLDETRALEGTVARLDALYEVLLPGLARRYREYLRDTDPLLDAPTVVVLERILAEMDRQREEAAALRRDLGLPARDGAALREREERATCVVRG